jgi:hypothetical protein
MYRHSLELTKTVSVVNILYMKLQMTKFHATVHILENLLLKSQLGRTDRKYKSTNINMCSYACHNLGHTVLIIPFLVGPSVGHILLRITFHARPSMGHAVLIKAFHARPSMGHAILIKTFHARPSMGHALLTIPSRACPSLSQSVLYCRTLYLFYVPCKKNS